MDIRTGARGGHPVSQLEAGPNEGDRTGFHAVGLSFVSLYYEDLEEAIAFYSRVLGPPTDVEEGAGYHGWRMGSTWLTLFASEVGTRPGQNPGNTEFAIQVAEPAQVDSLYQALVDAGATPGWAPEDTRMYVPMRYGYVEDPFGVRIDVYCPVPTERASSSDQTA
jgi:uncharacterized glyoxalase superfamily protein PhnB